MPSSPSPPPGPLPLLPRAPDSPSWSQLLFWGTASPITPLPTAGASFQHRTVTPGLMSHRSAPSLRARPQLVVSPCPQGEARLPPASDAHPHPISFLF